MNQPIVGPAVHHGDDHKAEQQAGSGLGEVLALTKKGKPQSNVIATALNWVTKCIQKPSRVPGMRPGGPQAVPGWWRR
jgi:hypothetical protein